MEEVRGHLPNKQSVSLGCPSDSQQEILNYRNLTYNQRGTLLKINLTLLKRGQLQDAGVLDVYKHWGMVVFPSMYKGCGLPVLEGQATERPVITVNFGARAGLGGKSALLVGPFNEDALREGELRVCEEACLRARKLVYGLKNLSKHRGNVIIAAYASIYEKCGGKRR